MVRIVFGWMFACCMVTWAGIGAAQESLDPTPYLPVREFPKPKGKEIDSDLTMVEGRNALALGEVVELRGRVLHRDGSPCPNAWVEILQSDANGFVMVPSEPAIDRSKFDRNFQGMGRCETDAMGRYAFRTILPVPTERRPAPVIEVRVVIESTERLTTVLFLRDHPSNESDPVFSSVPSLFDRELIQVEFVKKNADQEHPIGEWDIVLGATSVAQHRGSRPEIGAAIP